MTSVRRKLALASCALLSQGAETALAQSANANPVDWVVDTSYLSYVETNDRVSVKKSLVDLTRNLDDGSVSVNLVHDTMSGASPTGAIRSDDSSVTFTGASGGNGFSAQGGGDYSLSRFEDTRVQAGVSRDQELNRQTRFNYGGLVSREQDYDSFGSTLGLSRESRNRLSTLTVGFGFTSDTIYRSTTGDTPVPLGNTEFTPAYGKSRRNTYDALIGVTRVLNRRTVLQANVTYSVSDGYHSDPYKIISAADDNDRILANFHDSRPEARQRNSLYTKLVHKLRDSDDSIHASARLYRDDWGISSTTADLRYRYQFSHRQFLEPHVRAYRQSAADFFYRKLEVDASLDPILPDDRLASADYRLDQMNSFTMGLKYGIKPTTNTEVRVRGEYINRTFADSDYGSNNALVFQTSVRFSF